MKSAIVKWLVLESIIMSPKQFICHLDKVLQVTNKSFLKYRKYNNTDWVL